MIDPRTGSPTESVAALTTPFPQGRAPAAWGLKTVGHVGPTYGLRGSRRSTGYADPVGRGHVPDTPAPSPP